MEQLNEKIKNLNLEPIDILKNIGYKIYETNDNKWKDSPLEILDKLKIDHSGKVGELLVEYYCKYGNINYIYSDKDNTQLYDIIIKQKKVEIKTAKLGKHKSFQHEKLHNNGYDYMLFIDITPYYYYLTILPRFDLSIKSELIGRKAHLRKHTTNIFKLDFNEKNLTSLIDKGFSIKISKNTEIDKIVMFINDSII